MKKFNIPISVKVLDESTDYIVPLSIIFLAIVVSGTILFLAIS